MSFHNLCDPRNPIFPVFHTRFPHEPAAVLSSPFQEDSARSPWTWSSPGVVRISSHFSE